MYEDVFCIGESIEHRSRGGRLMIMITRGHNYEQCDSIGKQMIMILMTMHIIM